MRISVLDTSPIVAGSSARQALHNTVDLAVLADELGYHRYWVPEHHSMRGVASSAPAVLAGRLADATTRIRVGAGGVLLPNHAPLVVAEQFGTLAALHCGRIDLGIGRALGGPPQVAAALRRTDTGFPEQISELIGYFEATDEQQVSAVPALGNPVQFWLLGSSANSARLAATLGLPYAFARHLNPAGAVEATSAYREACPEPELIVSVSAIVADTDERAEWLAGPTRLKVRSRKRGERIPLPSPADVDPAELTDPLPGLVVGSPDTVREQLQAIADETGADELMITTPVYDHADRRRSYELLKP
ncbi:MAG TPA: LLM class flavin-dependent oxidoreductase [Pseudonocardiaceae bacterium]|nr:LLM class flavin-dependent oxidoreductase [Pseudonocardiaceae bacterium]